MAAELGGGAADSQNDESLHIGHRKAQRAGGSPNSIMVNVTSVGKDHHGIAPGDVMRVEVHDDGLLIKPAGAADDDEG